MNTVKPQDVVAFFANEAARVGDEVCRISTLLTQRAPGSNRPLHITGGYFKAKIEAGDEAFMEKVARAFEDLGEGWRASVSQVHDITGKHSVFTLTHESFAALASHGGSGHGSGSCSRPR